MPCSLVRRCPEAPPLQPPPPLPQQLLDNPSFPHITKPTSAPHPSKCLRISLPPSDLRPSLRAPEARLPALSCAARTPTCAARLFPLSPNPFRVALNPHQPLALLNLDLPIPPPPHAHS
eukprot:363804-Chlamydomonas_euryale.AAC.1